ncbi:hypothetical protein NBRC3293_0968 [Gluconobacter oxydans NBRC 3293]|uniref:Uncharacterized protein n=1 Tax=Gluconobacter oxydans NBRC 3293 TaxID=1315969 RepID=A0A829WUN9_GLUOY|nr:hypothetical protein NBRC3293_0968 [Gluconobacter oxydans NBRC 3293]
MSVDHVLGITGRAGHGAVEPGGVGVVLMVRYSEKSAWANVQMGDLRHQNSNLKQTDAEHGQGKPDWWLATSPVGISLGTGLEFRLGALLRFHPGWNVRVVMPVKGIVHFFGSRYLRAREMRPVSDGNGLPGVIMEDPADRTPEGIAP